MNKYAKRWVKALRSGKYKQTKNKLATPDGFCCLGVACEMFHKQLRMSKRTVRTSKEKYFVYGGHENYLPSKVVKLLGLSRSTGRFEKGCLADLNDDGKSFRFIARVIERRPKGLFIK